MAQYKILLTHKAERDLKGIDAVQRRRIGQKLQYFIATNDPLVLAVQLTGIKPPIYRFRIGKYRVFFDIKGNNLRVLSVSLRDKAYR